MAQPDPDSQRCPWCGYSLVGQREDRGRCPECGNPYDRRYARHPEYERQLHRKLHRIDRWLSLLITLFLLGVILFVLFN